MANKNLTNAIKAKKDEFYTQLSDIEDELKYYRKYFGGKTVLCNCDDPFESNFFKYFAAQFNTFGLKKLITTCYDGSPIWGGELLLFDGMKEKPKRNACKVEITEMKDYNGDGAVDLEDVKLLLKNGKYVVKRLEGNGDFRSRECVELLQEADVVVTNPPFSLFREYIAQLMEYQKKFIIIGNQNAVTYKEVFPLIMNNKIWFGESIHSGDRKFNVPDDYPLKAANCGIDEKGKRFVRVKGVRWFTNLEIPKRNEELVLYKKYNPDEYCKYDDYNAINVNKTGDIPCDYDGVMGVPITFLDKYCPSQFEILGIDRYIKDNPRPNRRFTIKGKEIYARILIRRKTNN